MLMSIYASVNTMVPQLLRVVPDFLPRYGAISDLGAHRLMYELAHYVIAKVQAGESASLAPLCDTLEAVLADGDWPVRSVLGVLMGAMIAQGSMHNVSPEPFRSLLGEKGRQFWQETDEFQKSVGPLRYEEGTY